MSQRAGACERTRVANARQAPQRAIRRAWAPPGAGAGRHGAARCGARRARSAGAAGGAAWAWDWRHGGASAPARARLQRCARVHVLEGRVEARVEARAAPCARERRRRRVSAAHAPRAEAEARGMRRSAAPQPAPRRALPRAALPPRTRQTRRPEVVARGEHERDILRSSHRVERGRHRQLAGRGVRRCADAAPVAERRECGGAQRRGRGVAEPRGRAARRGGQQREARGVPPAWRAAGARHGRARPRPRAALGRPTSARGALWGAAPRG